MMPPLNLRTVVTVALLAALVLLPVYAKLAGNLFLLTLFTRIVILAMAAVSLNLILGFGGMMSFGHAAYLGIGGYAVGILAFEGVPSGFVQWPVALAASALFALVIGALSLRTRGVYFIMITLGLRADGLLHLRRAGALRRRRRPYHPKAQPVLRRPSTSPTRCSSTTSAWRCCSPRSIWSGGS